MFIYLFIYLSNYLMLFFRGGGGGGASVGTEDRKQKRWTL